jgi:hypothetical protein
MQLNIHQFMNHEVHYQRYSLAWAVQVILQVIYGYMFRKETEVCGKTEY